MSNFGWHFVGEKLRDGRPIPRDGVWLEHDGPVVICMSGLHGSRRPWNALHYAPGAVLCRVEFGGVVEEHGDKLVARKRRIICRTDITNTLRYFERMRALSVAHLWTPDDVVLEYLMTGDERIKDSAWDSSMIAAKAAWNSSQDASWDAAWAARAAARAASGDAAWKSSQAAAWDSSMIAAWTAARDSDYYAAIDKAGLEFDSLVYEQFGIGGNDAE